ncbi:MAG: glycosyltransferase family 4 protein [bacterium]|nr:glycosyltransferase family 4 protein [bacterium]
MKIGFYNPYFDGFGGGERYVLTLASHWSARHDVTIFWNDPSVLDESTRRFQVDLSRVHVENNIFLEKNFMKKLRETQRYDLLFFLSDGSIPTSFAPRNILHMQVPFPKINAPKWKLSRFQRIVVNSKFTKDHIDPIVGARADVIYPPVELPVRQRFNKDTVILSVGRFTSYHNAKKQHVLIEAFENAHRAGLWKNWRLVFVGGLLPSDRSYYDALKTQAKGLPIEFYPNADHETLVSWYKKASLYWHAAGFRETDPRLMEHFGISTVEAMGWGSVPIVYDGGGQHEIVQNNRSGYLWKNQDELREKTSEMIASVQKRNTIATNAEKRAREFNTDRFLNSFDEILQNGF